MPGGKQRLIARLTGGIIAGPGSTRDRVSGIFAGSVSVESPSFDAGAAGSRENLSATVTGLDASHLVVAIPASMPGACVALISACAIENAIETTWGYIAGSGGGAAAASPVTLQYIAFTTQTQSGKDHPLTLIPSSGSTFEGNSASIPNSKDRAVWMGVVTAAGTSGSAAFYDDVASAAGRQILRLGASGGHFSGMHGPFISGCAISYGAIEDASIIAWVQDT